MKKTLLLLIAGLFLFSACTPFSTLQSLVVSSTPTFTSTSKPTLTPEPTLAPTNTPKLMNTDSVRSMLEERLPLIRNIDIEIRSVSYTGGKDDEPSTLFIRVEDRLKEYSTGCMAPLIIMLVDIRKGYPRSAYPASAENVKVECYTSDSKLRLSFVATFDDVEYLASVPNDDLDSAFNERVSIITNNLPPYGTLPPVPTFTPLATYTPRPTTTPPPSLDTADPMAGVTAVCKDGTYSYSAHQSGTCSRHGGVKEWIHRPPN
jgi:hypothetical protein